MDVLFTYIPYLVMVIYLDRAGGKGAGLDGYQGALLITYIYRMVLKSSDLGW